eukprot:12118853-Ditylum_brightwellii.AAC.1
MYKARYKLADGRLDNVSTTLQREFQIDKMAWILFDASLSVNMKAPVSTYFAVGIDQDMNF